MIWETNPGLSIFGRIIGTKSGKEPGKSGLLFAKGGKVNREDAQSILDGLLLGDGNLDLGGGRSARFRLSRQASTEEGEEKVRDYLSGIAEALRTLGIELPPGQPTTRTMKGKKMLGVRSRSSPLLTGLYDRWFGPPSGPRRKVPEGLELTPLTLAHWFESDGSTTLEQGNLVRLVIRPCQFGREGNLKLQKLLESIGIKVRLRRSYDKRYNTECWHLAINDASTVNRFLDMVEPHIHPRYRDKVKRPWLKVLIVGGKREEGPFVWREGDWKPKEE